MRKNKYPEVRFLHYYCVNSLFLINGWIVSFLYFRWKTLSWVSLGHIIELTFSDDFVFGKLLIQKKNQFKVVELFIFFFSYNFMRVIGLWKKWLGKGRKKILLNRGSIFVPNGRVFTIFIAVCGWWTAFKRSFGVKFLLNLRLQIRFSLWLNKKISFLSALNWI